jgi:hypothetical protein
VVEAENLPKEKEGGLSHPPANCASARSTTSPPRMSRTEKTSPGCFHCSENSLEGMPGLKVDERVMISLRKGGIAQEYSVDGAA